MTYMFFKMKKWVNNPLFLNEEENYTTLPVSLLGKTLEYEEVDGVKHIKKFEIESFSVIDPKNILKTVPDVEAMTIKSESEWEHIEKRMRELTLILQKSPKDIKSERELKIYEQMKSLGIKTMNDYIRYVSSYSVAFITANPKNNAIDVKKVQDRLDTYLDSAFHLTKYTD